MNINNNDLDFLIHLENKLNENEDYSDDVQILHELVEKLKRHKQRTNKRTLEIITEKRKTNPFYGRSQKEIERIKARDKKENN